MQENWLSLVKADFNFDSKGTISIKDDFSNNPDWSSGVGSSLHYLDSIISYLAGDDSPNHIFSSYDKNSPPTRQ